MKEAKVVIGANFGDEGKGLMTDYFCSRFPSTEKVLNVRFNGGAQAGHTVVTPDGREHIFSHFGSGSFLPNVATWFGPDFIMNPILFRREYEQLVSMGVHPMVYVHPSCLLTMPQDMMTNQFLERRRGKDRHGSCGVGIFETILRGQAVKQICVDDISRHMEAHCGFDIDYYEAERIEKMTGMKLEKKEKELFLNQNIQARFLEDVRFTMNHCVIAGWEVLDNFDNVVFEGAQGLMLDRNNLEYFPHLTPSNTGLTNIAKFISYLDNCSNADIEVCYVTRPYLTRHGAGMLPDECSREEVCAGIDLTNHENEWQGEFRYGKLDWKSLIDRCEKDIQKLPNAKMTIAVTHMDEVHDMIKSMGIQSRLMDETDPVSYLSYGRTRQNVHKFRSILSVLER